MDTNIGVKRRWPRALNLCEKLDESSKIRGGEANV